MKIEKIRVKNFFSFGPDPVEFKFDKKFTLVTGKNGQGKSTLFTDAIVFCLFGSSVKKVGKKSVINWSTGRDCEVQMHILDEGHEYVITRSEKPYALTLMIDGVLVDEEASRKGTQKHIDHLLKGMNPVAFEQLNIIASASYRDFLSIPKTERLKLIDTLLGLESYEIAYRVAKEQLKEAKTELTKLDKRSAAANTAYNTTVELLERMKSETESAVAKKTELRATMAKDIAELRVKYVALKQKIAANTPAYDEAKTRLTAYKKAKSAVLVPGSKCDLCGSDLSPEHILQIESELSAEHARLQSLRPFVEEYSTDAKALEAMTRTGMEMSSKLETIDKDLSKKHESIVSADEIVALQAEISDAESAIKRLESEISVIERTSDLLSKDGLPKAIRSAYMKKLENKVNAASIDFNIPVNVVITESGDVEINTVSGQNTSFSALSQGEVRRLDLAFLMAMRESIASHFDLMVFDETLSGSLDSNGRELVLRALDSQQMKFVIISHDYGIVDDLEEFEFSHWHVSKVNDFTKLERLQ